MLMKDDGTFLGVNDDIRQPSNPNIERARPESTSSLVEDVNNGNISESVHGESKRSRSPDEAVKEEEGPPSKRLKPSDADVDTCTAPPLENSTLSSSSLVKKNVYLAEGWRERWCRCPKVRIHSGFSHTP
jgi:hypothetical protein